MTTRIALRALLCLAFALTSIEVCGSVALQSFGVTPSVPGTLVFDSIGPMGPPGEESGPGASVAWPVTVDLALLNTLPLTLQVNFPDRSPVTLSRMRSERWSADTFLWTGRGADCSAIFRMAASGLKGMISCINAPYGIHHPAGSSDLRLTRYDDAGNQVWPESFPGLPAGAMPSGPKPAPPVGKPDTTVDVLVLYNGHLTSTPIWENARDQVIAIQHAMDLSTGPGQPVIAKIRLAGAARVARTVDNAPADDLQNLLNNAESNALRDYWAGDTVLYLTTGNCDVPGGVQGIAGLPGYQGVPLPGPAFAPFAIAVSLIECSDNPGDWVAAHEFAHNFGANHNPDHGAPNPTPVQPYAFGHWARETGTDDPLAARTIMSYLTECIQVVNPCPRIPHYSNPGVEVGGWFTTGTNDRNNARVIKLYAPVMALYRDSKGRIFKHGFE